MASKKKKIKEENREFQNEWTESFVFMSSSAGLPLYLICHENFANNKKSNLERHFLNKKQNTFAEKYPVGVARKRAIEELKHKADQSKNTFTKWMKSPSSTTTARYVATQEIVKRGEPFTDGELYKRVLYQSFRAAVQ